MPEYTRYDALSVGGVPIIPMNMLTAGNVWFVSSTTGHNGASRGRRVDEPLASLVYCLTLAGNHDVIVQLPGHVETIDSAALLTISKTGLRILGSGYGSLIPKWNITATAAYALLSGADNYIENLRITGAIDAIDKVLSVTGNGNVINKLITQDVTGQMTDGILWSGDDGVLANWKHLGASAAGTAAALALTAADRFELTNFNIDGNFSLGAIDIRTTASVDVVIHNGRARTRNSNDLFLTDTITGSTGWLGPNVSIRLADDAANGLAALAAATFVYIDPIYIVNAANEKGLVTNKTASGL